MPGSGMAECQTLIARPIVQGEFDEVSGLRALFVDKAIYDFAKRVLG